MNNNINLREDLADIMKDFGYYVLLQRMSKHLRCHCFSQINQEADSHCLTCFGTGWVSKLEKHKIYSQNQVQPISRPNLTRPGPLGPIYVSAASIWFEHFVFPQIGAYVFEVGWDKSKPVNLVRALKLTHIEPKRGDHGRTEFFYAASKSEPIDFDFLDFAVKKVGNIEVYQPISTKK